MRADDWAVAGAGARAAGAPRCAAADALPAPLAVSSALSDFERWLDHHGELSHDHQSYFAGRVGGAAKALYYRRKLLGTLAVAPMIFSEALLPAGRRLFHVPQRFPIADAHYAMGFAARAAATRSQAHYEHAVHFLDVLLATRSPACAHFGWGYPFDWVTRNGVMSAGTPLVTTTPYVYEAFAAVHALDGERRWADAMASIARHLVEEIPDRALDAERATAGYNPQDRQGNVVNASAYRAFALTAAAERFGNEHYRALARRNAAFVLWAQRADGAWPYATDGVRDFVDHFHTCFVLKALAKIERIESSGPLRQAIERGVSYYVDHLFDADGLPRPFAVAPRLTVYRHELYDYAECINLGVLLGARFPRLEQRLQSTVDDLLARWRKRDGSFRSRRLLLGWDNVPMHRWAQSQIFRSLALLASRPAAQKG